MAPGVITNVRSRALPIWYMDIVLNFVFYFSTIGNTRCAQLVPEQILKLKQLTVLTLAEINKVFLLSFFVLFFVFLF